MNGLGYVKALKLPYEYFLAVIFYRFTIVSTSPSGSPGVADNSIHCVAMRWERLVNSANLLFMRKPKIEELILADVGIRGSMVAMV
jgi:hypothetical protein